MGFKEKFLASRKFILIGLSVIAGAVGLTSAIIAEGSLNIDRVVPSLEYRSDGRFILYSQLFAGFLLFQLGLLGIYNYFKKNKILNFIFTIEALAIMIFFMIICINARNKFGKLENTISCSDLGPLTEAATVVEKSKALFCSSDCLCNAEKKWTIEYLIEEYNNNTDTPTFATEEEAAEYNEKEYAIAQTIDSSGPDKAHDCEVFNTSVGDYEETANMLQWIEETYSCSGICTKMPYFIFSDINSDEAPAKFCIDVIIDEGKEYANQVLFLALTVCCVLVLIISYMIVYIIITAKQQSNIQPESMEVKKMESMKKRKLLKEDDEDSPPMIYSPNQQNQDVQPQQENPQAEYAKF